MLAVLHDLLADLRRPQAGLTHASFPAIFRVAPHQPLRGPVALVRDLLAHLEAEVAVVGDVHVLRRLEVRAHALGVASLEHRPEHRAAEALALMGGIGAEKLEVVVRFLRVVLLEKGERASADTNFLTPNTLRKAGVALMISEDGTFHLSGGAQIATASHPSVTYTC